MNHAIPLEASLSLCHSDFDISAAQEWDWPPENLPRFKISDIIYRIRLLWLKG
jgi:hypothetical protein